MFLLNGNFEIMTKLHTFWSKMFLRIPKCSVNSVHEFTPFANSALFCQVLNVFFCVSVMIGQIFNMFSEAHEKSHKKPFVGSNIRERLRTTFIFGIDFWVIKGQTRMGYFFFSCFGPPPPVNECSAHLIQQAAVVEITRECEVRVRHRHQEVEASPEGVYISGLLINTYK